MKRIFVRRAGPLPIGPIASNRAPRRCANFYPTQTYTSSRICLFSAGVGPTVFLNVVPDSGVARVWAARGGP